MFPSSVEAKPHWVLRARLFKGTNWPASLMRFAIVIGSSNSPFFEVIKPRTIVTLSRLFQICLIGFKSPARSLSYSKKKRS